MRWLAAAAALTLTAVQPQPPPPPDTEIFLASLAASGDRLSVTAPINITNSPGYDNQPSFAPDGRSIFFTSNRGGTQTDIYRYDIGSAATRRITDTPESEYSPTVTPDRAHISVVRVEADGTQRLWQFTIDGREPAVVLRDVKPVGYHAWADPQTLVLFVLGPPATLQVADTRTGRAEILATDIGRSIQNIPAPRLRSGQGGTVSFVQRTPAVRQAADRPPQLTIRELDPKNRRMTTLIDAPAGAREADVAWTPDGTLLMSKDDVLYQWRRGATAWTEAVNLASLGLRGVSRIAVSPDGGRIALVAAAEKR